MSLFSVFFLWKASLRNNLLQLQTCSRRGGQQLERGQSPLLVTEADNVAAGVMHVRDASHELNYEELLLLTDYSLVSTLPG